MIQFKPGDIVVYSNTSEFASGGHVEYKVLVTDHPEEFGPFSGIIIEVNQMPIGDSRQVGVTRTDLNCTAFRLEQEAALNKLHIALDQLAKRL